MEFAIKLDTLREGVLHALTLTHGRALVARLRDGSVVAFTPLCPHQMGDLSGGHFDGTCIACPLHDYQFNVHTGQCVFPDDTLRLRTYATQVEDGKVFIDVPKAKWKMSN